MIDLTPALRLLTACVACGLVLPSIAGAAAPEVRHHLSLPGATRPRSLAASADMTTIYVGSARRRGLDELHAIATGPEAETLSLGWSLEIDAHVNAIAVDGDLLYLATSADHAELIVVDTTSRAVIGTFDAAGPADARSIEVVAPGSVLLGRRRGPGPEVYRLDVGDPAHIVALESGEAPRGVRPSKPTKLARYQHRGRLAARLVRETARGLLHYLAVTDRDAEVQVVEQIVPVIFADADGDGFHRLACLGDSNTTTLPGFPGWCERLVAMVDDADFVVVNVAAGGATVVSPNLMFDSDATLQMQRALARRPDAVVLSFGTNDVFQGRTRAEIQAAYLAQEAVARAAGVAVFVATTPPIAGCRRPSCPLVMASNALLRASFPGRILEFFDGFAPEHFTADGYHVSAAGQALRAERAFAEIANPHVYEVD